MTTGLDPNIVDAIYVHAREISVAAGQLLAERQHSPRSIAYKDMYRRDPVTDADNAAEGYLRGAIADRFPEHAILGEEGESSEVGNGEFLWALDPLDGTANYAAGLPIYAVSVAVLHRGAPIVGCIAVPGLSALYHARAGGGAFLDDTRIVACQHEQIVPGAPVGLFAGWRWAFAPHRQLRHRYGEPRAFGSIAAELGLVASGGLQYAVYAGPKLWDVAAGVLLVKEAGGAARSWQRGVGWQTLHQFVAADQPAGLRGWSAPTLVGGAMLVPKVARDLTPRRPLAAWRVLKKLAARRGAKGLDVAQSSATAIEEGR